MRFSPRIVILLGLWPAAGVLAAEVHRCTGPDGEVMFSQSPCGGHSLPTVIRPGKAAASPGLRAGELDWLERRQRERAQARAGERRTGSSPKTAAREGGRHACERRRMSLDDVNARLRRGYKPAQGERLKQRRRMLEHYIDTLCRRQ